MVEEENGNRVYEVSSSGTDTTGTGLGFGSTSWTNYAVEYRVKLINLKADIWMAFRNSDQGSYVQRLSSNFQHLGLYISPEGIPWEPLSEPTYNVYRGIWYQLRVEVQGETIRYFINDRRVIEITDTRLTAGDIAIGNLGDTIAQYDDIRVTALGEAITPSP